MGAKQKSFGNLFEDLFFIQCKRIQGMAITRFPDGCQVVGKNRVVRVKTPCDWILSFGGVTALIDTKTTVSETFPFSKICKHQISEMVYHEQSGAKAGYVIWFRTSDDIIFVSAKRLHAFIGQRGSLSAIDGSMSYLGKSSNFQAKMIFGMN